MAIGKRKKPKQQPLWIMRSDLVSNSGHPFYTRLTRKDTGASSREYVKELMREAGEYPDDTGAMLGVAIYPADQGDTACITETLTVVAEDLAALGDTPPELLCVVTDKGYNLGLILRAIFGQGTPKGMADALRRVIFDFIGLVLASITWKTLWGWTKCRDNIGQSSFVTPSSGGCLLPVRIQN